MKQVEHEINKRFKHKKLSNDDFDVEGLWANISTDLHQKPQLLKGKKKKSFWILGLVLFVALAAFYFYKKTMKTRPEIAKISISTEAIQAEKNAKAKENADLFEEKPILLNSEEHSFLGESLKEKAHIRANAESSTKHLSTAFSQKKDTQHTVETNAFSSKQNPSYSQKKVAFFDEKIATQNTTQERMKGTLRKTLDGSNQEVKQAINQSTTAQDKIQLESATPSWENPNPQAESEKLGIPFLPTQLIPLKTKPLKAIPFVPAVFYTKPKKSTERTQWQFGVEMGVNSLAFNYKSTTNPAIASLKNQAEKLQLGSSFGFHTGLLLKNKWTLHTGLEYHQLWSKFDIEHEKNVTINKSNQLLKVWIDASTQDTIRQEYGDITVGGVETHRVVHYNRYKQFQIPLELGHQRQHNRLIYGASLGALFNFTTSQTGRALDNTSEIIDFQHKTSEATLKTSSIGFRLSPIVVYQCTQNWAFYARPQWTFQSNTDLFGSDIKVGVQQFNVNVGLRYSL